MNEAFATEMRISRVRSDLTKDLTELKDFLNVLDSGNYCQEITKTSDEAEGRVWLMA